MTITVNMKTDQQTERLSATASVVHEAKNYSNVASRLLSRSYGLVRTNGGIDEILETALTRLKKPLDCAPHEG